MWDSGIDEERISGRECDVVRTEAVKRFSATIPAAEWEQMETPDFIGINVYNGDEIIFGQEVLISLYVYETGDYDLQLLLWQQPSDT